MKRNFLILAVVTMLTVGGIAYGVQSTKTDCPLEGTALCPKENCPLKGTALCPYENKAAMASTLPDCCKKK